MSVVAENHIAGRSALLGSHPLSLLKAKQVVAELERLGIGTWSADAVIKWTLEEPGLPIAQRAMRGKPHRYRLADVLSWLTARTRRELIKGVPDAAERLRRCEQAMAMFAAGDPAKAPPAAEQILPLSEPGLQLTPPEGATSAPISPAKPIEVDLSGINLQDRGAIELLLEIIHGRDPRTAKAAEEALRLRQKRLMDEGQLVPVEDAQRMTDGMAILIRMAIEDLPERFAGLVDDQSTAEQRRAAGQQLTAELLDKLEKAQLEPDAELEEDLHDDA